MKLTNYTKKEQEILKKESNLALCPYCKNLVEKGNSYCGSCGKRLDFTVSLRTSTST